MSRGDGCAPVLRTAVLVAFGNRRQSLALVAICVAVSGLSVLSLSSRAGYIAILSGEAEALPFTVGDGLLWMLAGYPVLALPAWLAPCALVLAAGLLGEKGSPQILASHLLTRRRVWAALCLASLTRVLWCLCVLLLGDVLWAVAFGGQLQLGTLAIDALSGGAIRQVDGTVVACFVGLLAAVLASLSIMGRLLGELAGRALALGLQIALLVASAYAFDVPLMGSWLMASRVVPLGTGASVAGVWGMGAGVFAAAVLLTVCGMAGERVLARADLLPRVGRGRS